VTEISKPRIRGSRRASALALTASLTIACGAPAPPTDLVVVTLDTLRVDHVGAYGSDRGLTPALDAFALAGLVHDATFTTMPTTSPAHASLMTGLPVYRHDVRRNGVPLPSRLRERGLAGRLREAGYATGAALVHRSEPTDGSPLARSLLVADRAGHCLAEGDHPVKNIASDHRLHFL
jgi:hypothetical protein